MTPQEAQMLQDLVRKIRQTALTEKDPDAEALLMDGLTRDPDALYKLAQTVLVQNLALNQARMQIEQLRQQAVPAAPAPARASTFLGSLLGHHEPPPPPAYSVPSAPPPPPYQAPPPPSYYADPAPSGAGSFLRSAATTAAGVAAGALAFQGVESLMHGFGHSSGVGEFGGLGMPAAGAPAEETVINNYYDSPADDDRARSADLESRGQSDNDSGRLEDASLDRDSDSSSDSESGYDDRDYQDDQDDQQLDDSGVDDGGDDTLV
jgi:uncharacterized protein